MSQHAMSLTYRAAPIALFLTGFTLIVLSEAPGMGWALLVFALALGTHRYEGRKSDVVTHRKMHS
jgi:hypothetical protein